MLPWIEEEIDEIISTIGFLVLKILALPENVYLRDYMEISI